MAWLLSTQLLFNSGNYRLRSIQGIRANRVAIRLATVYDPATICANPFIVYIKVNEISTYSRYTVKGNSGYLHKKQNIDKI